MQIEFFQVSNYHRVKLLGHFKNLKNKVYIVHSTDGKTFGVMVLLIITRHGESGS